MKLLKREIIELKTLKDTKKHYDGIRYVFTKTNAWKQYCATTHTKQFVGNEFNSHKVFAESR